MNYSGNTKIISITELWQFFNSSATLFCITGNDGFIKHVNPFVLKLTGFTEPELMGMEYVNFLHPDDRAFTLGLSDQLRSGNPALQFNNRLIAANGEVKWISWMASYVEADDSVYLTGQDHTNQKLTEEQLRQEIEAKQRCILEANLEAQEKTRCDIGRELHDNINQMLATASLYQKMAIAEKEQVEDLLERGNKIINDTISEVRQLSKALVSPDTKNVSLKECIQEMLEPFHGGHLQFILSCTSNIDELPPKLKLTVFRIIQEQVNNIRKHALARNVEITINLCRQKLTLAVCDDGRGFNTKSKKKGIGLRNIRSRTEVHNGHSAISSSPGMGCRLDVTIPDIWF